MNFTIAELRQQDIASVAKLWEMLFRNYPVSIESIKKYTFDNTDFDPAGCFTARVNDQVVGFVFATIMQIPETYGSEFPGCIPVIMVHREYQNKGIGKRLLEMAITYLRAKNITKIVPGYPTYIRSSILSFIGVNSQWEQALWFLRHNGFNVTGEVDSAKVSLENFTIPKYIIENEKKAAEQEIKTTTLAKQEQNGFLDFLKTAFEPSWHQEFARRLAKNEIILDNVLILKKAKEIIGFAGAFDIPESGIAALGIGIGLRKDFRGKGLGDIILFNSLELIKNKGGRECYIFGIGPKHFYENAGFKMVELWILMEKTLN